VQEVLVRHSAKESGVTGQDVGSAPTALTLDDVLAADAWARDETIRILEHTR
jgi:hypothetical protein